MLKSALNSLLSKHSRDAVLKRMEADSTLYSPARITPSNYFRFLRGPEYTTISGVEFIIPKDSLKGEPTTAIVFSEEPEEGSFKIKIGEDFTSSDIPFDADAQDIQSAIENRAKVTRDGIYLNLIHPSPTVPDVSILSDDLMADFEEVTTAIFTGNTPWQDTIRKGDRVIEANGKTYVIDEIMEMPDIGGNIMGYRCRCD